MDGGGDGAAEFVFGRAIREENLNIAGKFGAPAIVGAIESGVFVFQGRSEKRDGGVAKAREFGGGASFFVGVPAVGAKLGERVFDW